MEINTVPANLAGALGDLTYTIKAEKTETADLEVLSSDGNSVMAVRRLSGSEEYRVNVSGYINAQLRVMPDTDSPTGIMPRPGAAACCSVRIGEAVSPLSVHCAGEKQLDYLMPMCGSVTLLRMYGPGRDEVAFVSGGEDVSWKVAVAGKDGEETVVLEGVSETEADKVYSVVVDSGEVIAAATLNGIEADGCTAILLSVTASGQEFIHRQYRLAGSIEDGVSLAWLNEWGGIDRACFRLLESRVELDNLTAELQDGCRSVGGSSCEVMRLASPVVDAAEAERLMGIMHSPMVWETNGGEITAVVVASRELSHAAGELNQIVLEVRKSRRFRSHKL